MAGIRLNESAPRAVEIKMNSGVRLEGKEKCNTNNLESAVLEGYEHKEGNASPKYMKKEGKLMGRNECKDIKNGKTRQGWGGG